MELNKLAGTVQQFNDPYQQQLQGTSGLQSADAVAVQQTTAATQPANDNVKIGSSSLLLKNLDTMRAIEQMHANLNQQAKAVRETNEALSATAGQVVSAQNNLQGITKNFPPYSMTDPARKEILMEYTSLRKEILRLMVPPPPPPVYEKVKLMWGELFSDNGQMLPSAVPALEQNSNDAAVKQATDNLNDLGNKITGLSSAMTQALVNP